MSATELPTYKSGVTGRTWRIYSGNYYDCHVVSLPQILPVEVFHRWLTIVSAPRIESGWNGIYCRSLLDSEARRDVVLFDIFGVNKTFVSIEGDIEANIRQSVREGGFAICRVDSFYHKHFTQTYDKTHSPGHKITVIDWDDECYVGIDSTGMRAEPIRMPRQALVNSVLANLYYAYEKEDTIYRVSGGEAVETALRSGDIDRQVLLALTNFAANRRDLVPKVASFADGFRTGGLTDGDPAAYTYIRNIYKAAQSIEYCYSAVVEGEASCKPLWAMVAADPDAFVQRLGEAAKSWRFLKMLLKTAERDGSVNAYRTRVEVALAGIERAEQAANEALFAAPAAKPMAVNS